MRREKVRRETNNRDEDCERWRVKELFGDMKLNKCTALHNNNRTVWYSNGVGIIRHLICDRWTKWFSSYYFHCLFKEFHQSIFINMYRTENWVMQNRIASQILRCDFGLIIITVVVAHIRYKSNIDYDCWPPKNNGTQECLCTCSFASVWIGFVCS